MELGKHIKTYRAQRNLSQEELAHKIYVSRQTVSNWETDKTYPDVQSLLLLSVLFDVTIDELVKGDVEEMKKALIEDARKMNVLSWVMLAFALAALIAVVGGISFWGWGIIPSAVIAILLYGICLTAAFFITRLKEKHDIVTYRELAAFGQGEPIDRNHKSSQQARRHKVAKTILRTLAGAAVGGTIGYFCFMLFG